MPQADFRLLFDGADLLRRYPPLFQHPHKRMLFQLAYPPDRPASGQLEVTRWLPEAPGQVSLPLDLNSLLLTGFYDYQPVDPSAQSVEWHVNFGDPHLFVAYGSRLFAQDEMQVMEHPLLGSVREALIAGNYAAHTVDGADGTPVLIKNVERRLAVATEPNPLAGRRAGLYGNNFAVASGEAVQQATEVLVPPTYSNLMSMAAPSYGHGKYRPREISNVLQTSLLGFSAACLESAGRPVVIHSGFWGCGAFGGNRRLMIALQAIAARASGISQLVLHVGDRPSLADAQRGLEIAEAVAVRLHPDCEFAALVERFTEMEFQWGVSDGN